MENIKSLFRMYKQVSYILTPKQKRNAIVVFASMLLCSCLELIGVSAIYPFLQMMLDADSMKNKWYLQWIYFMNPSAGVKEGILVIGIAIIFVYLAKNMATMGCSYVQFRYAASFQRESSTLMLDSFMKRQYEYFINTNSSDITRGIAYDTSCVYRILLDGFQIISELITAFLIALYLFITDWVIAIWAVALASICFMFIVFYFKGKMKQAGIDTRIANANQAKWMYQAVQGIKEVTVLDRREIFVEQYSEASKEVEKNIVINTTISAAPDRILEGVCISGFMLIIIVRVLMGANMVVFVPTLGAFAMGAFRLLPSISKISSRINDIVFHKEGLYNCYLNIQEVRELEKERHDRYLVEQNKINMEANLIFKNELVIDKICWKYKNAIKDILTCLSLTIRKGESVALIGASGAGKTTLADIILGLLEPQKGTVKMDGIDIFAIPHQWSKIIGYVPQTVYLIDDTVRSNIAFGLSEDMVDDEKIWRALEQAQLKGFVENLPRKLDTFVGERGVKLSGGQRQRIAIARALYEDPDILVLDEATSALDTETETAVMESIDALQGTKTLIIVAHRLSTIRNCDTIYEISNGAAQKKSKHEIFE